MANVPLRLQVLRNLTACLEQTSGSDHLGQPFDLRGQVFRGRTEFGEETSLPAVSILEGPQPDIGIYAGFKEARNTDWLLLMQGWAKDDKANPNDPAYWLQAAVEEQLSKIMARKPGRPSPLHPEFYLLGGLITEIEIGPPVVRPLQEKASARAFFYQPIRVGLAEYVGETYIPT